MHYDGVGIAKDLAKACAWHRKAADQGHKISQYLLGMLYWNGVGVPKDEAEAFKYITKSAEQGYYEAQSKLGTLLSMQAAVIAHEKGYKLPEDWQNDHEITSLYRMAAEWYGKAIAQGDADSLSGLGFMYLSGNGVPKDEMEAYKLFRAAAEKGDISAQHQIGEAYRKGRFGLQRNEREAVQWLTNPANQGMERAQYTLASIYDPQITGDGSVAKSETEAVKWYRESAMRGDLRAKDKLTQRGIVI